MFDFFTGTSWIDQYQRFEDESIEVDLTSVQIPAHPDPKFRYGIFITFPHSNLPLLGKKVPVPSTYVVAGHLVQATWWLSDAVAIPPEDVPKEKRKADSTFKHLSAAFKNVLGGKQEHGLILNVDAIENDLMSEFTVVHVGMPQTMKTLKQFWLGTGERYNEAGLRVWNSINYDFDEARRLAHMSKSPAAQAARMKNMELAREKARDFHRSRSLERAQNILVLVEEGFDNQQLAEKLGISVASVPTTVARARKALGVQEADTKPRTEKPLTSAHIPAPVVHSGNVSGAYAFTGSAASTGSGSLTATGVVGVPDTVASIEEMFDFSDAPTGNHQWTEEDLMLDLGDL